jgi:starch-binding outer membrane protein, SusD/RagB family
MKKQFLKGIASVLILAGIFSACKKSVDLFPTDNINESNAFQTVDDLERAVLAAYGSWPGETIMYNNALLADEAKISNENRGQGQFIFKWEYNPSSGDVTGAWNTWYIIIGRINKALAQFDKVQPRNAAETTLKDRVFGEMHAIRAIAHFELMQNFAGYFQPDGLGVPYTVTSDLTARPARERMGAVIQKIEADLSIGKSAPLPTAPSPTGTAGIIRLSKAAVAGFQARVALYKRDWTAAATFATEAITTSSKPLATRATFPGIWTDQNENEVMLRLRRNGTSVGTLWQDNNGDVFFEPSDQLKNRFDRSGADIRFPTYFRINPTAPDTALVNKFFESARGPKIVDVKLMRSAEMHLIRAEARASNNDLPGAAADINALRSARIEGYTNVTFANQQDAINAIMNERAKELCYEGFRFYDMQRRRISVQRLASDVQSTLWQNLPSDNFRFVMPIPNQSILSNPNMVQNPGY